MKKKGYISKNIAKYRKPNNPNTNKRAWRIASKEPTAAKRSKMYYMVKNHRISSSIIRKFKEKGNSPKSSKTTRKNNNNITKKEAEHSFAKRNLHKDTNSPQMSDKKIKNLIKIKKILLDFIIEQRSNSLTLYLSTEIADKLIEISNIKLSKEEYNYLKNVISLITIETMNSVLNETVTTIDKIYTYCKVGNQIYEITIKIKVIKEKIELFLDNISKKSSEWLKYKYFIKDNPKIEKYFEIKDKTKCLSKKEIEIGEKCSLMLLLQKQEYIPTETNTPNSCPYYNYCNSRGITKNTP